MPLVPNLLETAIFVTFNQAPGPLLDLWGGPAFRVVLASVRLGIFPALSRQPQTPEALAQALGLDGRGVKILLETLATLRLVKAQGARYANSAMAQKWLTPAGEADLSPYFRYWGAITEEFWPRLDEALRTGQPPVNLYAWLETQPEVSRDFQEGMVAINRYAAADVIKAIELPETASRLLDVGGGHGTYSMALCRKYPRLAAVVFDSPQALASAAVEIDAAGMEAQMSMHAGDFLVDDLGHGYDAALLFNILHGQDAAANLALLQRVRATLKPGGTVVVLDQAAHVSPLPLGTAITQLLSMSYYLLLGGQVYEEATVTEWLHRAGFAEVKRKAIPKASSALYFGA